MKTALIVQGDCPCHPSREIADVLAKQLRARDFDVAMTHTMDTFRDAAKMAATDLIVMHWHMAYLTTDQLVPFLGAVERGTGLAGIHGFMGDACRTIDPYHNAHAYHYMVGGHWVAHPGDDGVSYRVRIADRAHPITAGLDDFTVISEKYYMHVDPAITAVATTDFGAVTMPIAWTKSYGAGRVFYHSLGHRTNIVRMPEVLRLTAQGMVWAAR